VQRLLAVLLVVAFIVLCVGCGNVFVGGAIQQGTSSVNGFVSVVEITVVNGATVTFVTFLSGGTSSTVGFCGDQRPRFPMNQNVRTNFHPGASCNDIVTVVTL
jgi:hypothetical protein